MLLYAVCVQYVCKREKNWNNHCQWYRHFNSRCCTKRRWKCTNSSSWIIYWCNHNDGKKNWNCRWRSFKIESHQQGYKGILLLPKKAKLGVYVAYVYYFNLFKKIKKLPADNILKNLIRISNKRKTSLFFISYIKLKLKYKVITKIALFLFIFFLIEMANLVNCFLI